MRSAVLVALEGELTTRGCVVLGPGLVRCAGALGVEHRDEQHGRALVREPAGGWRWEQAWTPNWWSSWWTGSVSWDATRAEPGATAWRAVARAHVEHLVAHHGRGARRDTVLLDAPGPAGRTQLGAAVGASWDELERHAAWVEALAEEYGVAACWPRGSGGPGGVRALLVPRAVALAVALAQWAPAPSSPAVLEAAVVLLDDGVGLTEAIRLAEALER